jgi:hypothetical protein
VPAADLKKLATAFDTPEDPILLMKSCSLLGKPLSMGPLSVEH